MVGRRSGRALAILFVVLIVAPLVGAAGGDAGPVRTRAAVSGATPLDCAAGSVRIGHLTVGAGAGCGAAGFTVRWVENLSDGNPGASYNFSYSSVAVAEVSPSGAIDALAPLAWAPNGSTSVTPSADGVEFTVNETAPVAPTSGPWVPGATFGPASTWAPWPGGWLPGDAATGNVSVITVFHLGMNASNGTASAPAVPGANGTGTPPENLSGSLKFDLDVLDWPWRNPADHLGLILDATAAEGAHFVFNGSTGNLTQVGNATGRPVVSLLFGAQATALAANGSSGPVAVTPAAYLWPNATTPRDRYGNIAYGFDADLLINFTGGPGGYRSLVYDPWIVFHVTPTASPGAPSGPFGALGLSAASGSVAVTAVAAAAIVQRGRSRRRRAASRLARRLAESEWAADARGEPVEWGPP